MLDFEKPIIELEQKIEDLTLQAERDDLEISDTVETLNEKKKKMLTQIYSNLSPWQKTQVARHPKRPHTTDYIKALIEDFTPLAGDRSFGEDHAIISGIGRFEGRSVLVLGHEKGKDMDTRVHHNFGMAKPEGYRKSIRLMELAEQFNLPILTFVDTAGAFPGVEAEERGQAEAIARSIQKCLQVKTPLLSLIIGEGGSGGAIALAAADKVFMLEHSIYSVISPEGCASILWRSAEEAKTAAEALRLTAQDLQKLGIIDGIIPEPRGAAHRNTPKTMAAVRTSLLQALDAVCSLSPEDLIAQRHQKYLEMGKKKL